MSEKTQQKQNFRIGFIVFNILFIILAISVLDNIVPFEIKSLLSKDHPVRMQYEKDLQSFNDENLFWIQVTNQTPFKADEIQKISEYLITNLKTVRWIEDPMGPSNAKYFSIQHGQLAFKKFITGKEITEEGLKKLATPFWQNTILSNDHSSLLISARFSRRTPRKEEKVIFDNIKAQLRSLKKSYPSIDFGLIGAKVASAAFFDELILQQTLITPLLVIILGVFFYYLYRSFAIVFWCYYSIFICYGSTLILIIINENGLGPYSTFALMFTAIVATSDLIHLWCRYNQLDGDHEKRLQEAFKIAKTPCLLTSITTCIGFLALIVNQNLPVRYFGLYCAFGCFVEWTFIFYVLPYFIRIFSFKPVKHEVVTEGINNKIHQFIFRRSGIISLISIFLFIILSIASLKLKVDDNFYTKFEEHHFLSRSIKSFENKFNFVGTVDLIIDLKNTSAFDHDFLKTASDLDKELKSIPHITRVTSLAGLEEEIAASSTGGPVPMEQKFAILDYLNNLGLLTSLYNEHRRTAKTTLYIDSMSTERLEQVLERVEVIRKKYSGKLNFNVSGFANVRSYINSRVIKDFFESFFLSFFLIFGCYYWLYRDLKLSVLALLPNILPILSISGLLGIFGIPTDTNLVILVCVAFGISGDNTIHLSYVSQQYQKQGDDYSTSVKKALNLLGPAFWGTSVIFIVALPPFMLGNLRLFKQMAIFLSISFIIAFLSDVVLFPALQKEFLKWKLRSRA